MAFRVSCSRVTQTLAQRYGYSPSASLQQPQNPYLGYRGSSRGGKGEGGQTPSIERRETWLVPSIFARLLEVDESARKSWLPDIWMALPTPVRKRHARSSGKDPQSPEPAIPTAMTTGPATMSGRRPTRSARSPQGRLSSSRAMAKAETVVPMAAALTPKSCGRTEPSDSTL